MLDDLRQAAATDLQTILPALRECRPHAGRFDLNELKRLSARTPAVYVSVLGIVETTPTGTGEMDLELSLAAYVVTADTRDLPRDTAAVNIVEAICSRIEGNRWGISEGVHPARQARANNLYAGEVDRWGVAMWAVSWRQAVRVGENIWDDDGTVPSSLYVGIAPDIGADHEDDYTLLAEAS